MNEETKQKLPRKVSQKRFKAWDPRAEASTYDADFYEKHRKYYEKGISHFVEWLNTNLTFESLVDVGCGCGDFIAPLVGHKKILGVDFSTGADVLMAKEIPYVIHDLTTPLPGPTEHYDVVMSLEVFEHIPRDYEETYLMNLLHFEPTTLIVSCAAPGQWGRHHYNCRGRDEVVAMLASKGYVLDEALTASFQKIKKLAAFYRKNTAVLVRDPSRVTL